VNLIEKRRRIGEGTAQNGFVGTSRNGQKRMMFARQKISQLQPTRSSLSLKNYFLDSKPSARE
jgi:hypothetical protein